MRVKPIIFLVIGVLAVALVVAGLAQLFRNNEVPETPPETDNDNSQDVPQLPDAPPSTDDPSEEPKTKEDYLRQAIVPCGYERVDSDSVRFIYTVNRESIQALESLGYTVSYGGVASIKSLGDTVVNAESPSVSFDTSSGFAATGNESVYTLVYDSSGSYSPTGTYIQNDDYTLAFAIVLSGMGEREDMITFESRAFLTLSYTETQYYGDGEKVVEGGNFNADDELTWEEANQLAKNVVTFVTYETVNADRVRWIFKVDKERLATLENAGYNVSFGAMATMMAKDGYITFEEVPHVVYSQADGFIPANDRQILVLVHNTDGTLSPSDLYTTEDGEYKYFSYALTGISKQEPASSTFVGTAFVALNYNVVGTVMGSTQNILLGPTISLADAQALAQSALETNSCAISPGDLAYAYFKANKDVISRLEGAGYRVVFGATIAEDSANPVRFTGSRYASTDEIYVCYDTNNVYNTTPGTLYAQDEFYYYFDSFKMNLQDYDKMFNFAARAFIAIDDTYIYYSPTTEFTCPGGAYTEPVDVEALKNALVSFKSVDITPQNADWYFTVNRSVLEQLEARGYTVTIGAVYSTLAVDGVSKDGPPTVLYGWGEYHIANSNQCHAITYYDSVTGGLPAAGKEAVFTINACNWYGTAEVYTYQCRAFISFNHEEIRYVEGTVEDIPGPLYEAPEVAQAKALAASMPEFYRFEEISDDAVRWIYRVKKSDVKTLEDMGYEVSFGATSALKSSSGSIVNSVQPYVNYAPGEGFTSGQGNSVTVLVYNTNGNYSPSNIFFREDDTYYYYSVAVTGLENFGSQVLELFGRSFISLNGEFIYYSECYTKELSTGTALTASEFAAAKAALIRFDHATSVMSGDGMRWVFKVDKAALTKLQNAGYNVSYGAVATIRSRNGEIYNTTSSDISINTSAAEVYDPTHDYALSILVYSTDGLYSPTNIFFSETDTHIYFTYTVTGFAEKSDTFVMDARAFAAINHKDPVYADGGIKTIVGGKA